MPGAAQWLIRERTFGMRKIWIYFTAITSLFFIMLHSCSTERVGSSKTSGEKPNVIIILVDALRADHLGCYGYHMKTSPNIDELAGAGVLFSMAMSPSSWTKPSVPSLFTSLYPSRHGVFEGSSKDTRGYITSDILQDSLLTIAEVFHQNDYSTFAFVHNAHLKGFLGFSQGFDIYNDRAANVEEINSEFLHWLKEKSDQPFFAYLHYLDVHWPYRPPAPYDTIFGDFKSEIDFYSEEWKSLRDRINDGEMRLDGTDITKMISLYDGELRYLDDNLGVLFDELKKESLYNNTLFIITADHGEEFLEHGKIGHGQSLYGELLHIPLIMKFPGRKWEGKKVEYPAELIDILPTLIDYFSWQPIQSSDGHTLLGSITGEKNDESFHHTYSELLHTGRYQRAFMEVPFKIIETYSGKIRRGASQTFLPDIHIGDRVEIKGMPGENDYFIADKISLDDNQDDDDVEIKGILSRTSDNNNFMILGFKIVILPSVEVRGQDGEPFVLNNLREGMRVKLNGHMYNGDKIEVNRINVRRPDTKRYSLEGIIDSLVTKEKDSSYAYVAGIRILIDSETETGSDPRTGEDTRSTSSLTAIELFDLSIDPSETEDLSTTRKDITGELQVLMNHNFPSVISSIEVPSREVLQLDPETVEELKAIGYID
jgi:arylsulfatase A-like enzyme